MKCEDLPERSMGKTKILLAEDDLTQASIMKDFLESNGHEVLLLAEGSSVMSVVKRDNPDVILLDRPSSDTDDTQVCRSLKRNRDTSGIPIIMLTNKSSPSDKIMGLTAGADDYIPKPYNHEELSALICARLRTKTEWDNLKQKTRRLEEMLSRVKTLAHVDPLTGLYNRRRFETVLASEFKRAMRYQFPLSCLMLDIDHFKKVNDKCGHIAGDHVLRDTVKIIQDNMRESDTVARWGGEEFAILSPNTSKEKALVVGERIRKAMSSYAFPSVGDIKITISIGIADVPHATISTIEQLIEAADAALYEAKKGGRNKVKVAS
ncbi:MAG TPA: diguanylate cyclase [Nitrospirota bacterium]|nr:diguanylate cyclase [Nitrospirota bacterium]